ncbi:LysR family transcriptional regulator [Saccharopolyspora sp. NPDC049426]|uniref:LysR substrate-binding domain-containing protein n=1 Tax=Saccharopolyspora sp. NPDC049426 TaxID=3155652 RepID=UPI0034474B16
METRQLRYVVRLAETLHFGRAANLEHIAQSAFSGHVARLERELGVQLFDRSHHRVSLTPAGTAFVERAEQVLAQLTEAAAEARAQATSEHQVLRIGTFAQAAGELLPTILSVFQQIRPDVRIEFTELTMIDQLEKLVAGDIDVAAVHAPFEDQRVVLKPIFTEPRLAAVSRRHSLADAASISVDDLLDESFALADPHAPPGWAAYWACDERRGEPGKVAAQVRSVGECLMAISSLDAVDTVPETTTRFFQHPGVTYVPLSDDTAPATVNVATRREDRRQHVQAFQTAVDQAISGHLGLVPNACAPTFDPRNHS